MRTVLVCVRSPGVARDVSTAAARLGLAAAVRTATSEPEVMLRLAEAPADVVLADTALARSDTAGFTRRVLARAPRAALLFFGADRAPAAAVIAAGARGLVGSSDPDAACVVAKALLLLAPSWVAGQPNGASTVVPAQRDVVPAPDDPAVVVTPVRPGGPGSPPAEAATAERLRTGSPQPFVLTEREAQVLRAMADGKSNAEIGRELYLSEDTVKTYARRIFRKLGARDRAHAVAAGFRAGLVV
ncbi:MAG TPA: response regulator transcription factor [Micromonosporaceae bacterium]|nr:response regulator transcription factor [Micromonosporaceae bacterium]